MNATVLLTDYAWPDTELERRIIEAAGHKLVAGPSDPAPVEAIEQLAVANNPAAILTCWGQVSERAIAASPRLKIVARMGVGLDNIAVPAATARGIWVTNVPDYCVAEVSDHAVGFSLCWTRGLVHFDRDVREGYWRPAGARLRRLADLTCGIVGFGRIGRATAGKMAAFGCKVIAHDPFVTMSPVEMCGFDNLMARSDIVIVHAPLTETTRHLIDAAALAKMRPGGLLINVSRGGVVDTNAVVDALQSGHLGAVGLDVLENEPTVPDALRKHPAAMLTPHVAFSSDASLLELRRRACEEVVRVLAGEPPEQPRNNPVA